MLRKTQTVEKWKESSDDNVKIKYSKQVNKTSKVVRIANRDFERKVANSIKKTLRLCKYARSKRELNQELDH